MIGANDIIDKCELSLDNSTANFEAMIFSNALYQNSFRDQATEDTFWAGASALFVLVYFVMHMKSLVLAVYCILIIIFSFAVTQMIFVEVLKIQYFSTLHNLVIFIILGISADNVFVIFDAWKQSD